jgi:hypothetical protein
MNRALLLAAALLAAACASSPPAEPPAEPWISIAMVSGLDRASQERARLLLEEDGIPSAMEGSAIHGIAVPASLAARARERLLAAPPGDDAGWLVAPDVPVRGERETAYGVRVADALGRSDLGPAVDAALRHPETAARAREYPVLLRAGERERLWRRAGGAEVAWHEVEVVLAADAGSGARRIVIGYLSREGTLALSSLRFETLAH